MLCTDSPQDTLVAIRVTLPEKDEDTDEPSPAESLQTAVRMPVQDDYFCNLGVRFISGLLSAVVLVLRYSENEALQRFQAL